MRIRTQNCLLCLLIVLLALSFADTATAQVVPGCGSLENNYGPFDYRDPVAKAKHLRIVEEYHFTPDVERLIRGNTSSLISDLDYTLRAWPNHYRALESLKRYALSGGRMTIRPAECYFKRAVAFRPDDSGAHIIYGNYLLQCAKLKNDLLRRRLQCAGFTDPGYMDTRVLKAAREQYETSLRLAPTSAEVNYDAGLFYLELHELDMAKRLAAVAYSAGYPLMGLKEGIAAAEARQTSKTPSAESSR